MSGTMGMEGGVMGDMRNYALVLRMLFSPKYKWHSNIEFCPVAA